MLTPDYLKNVADDAVNVYAKLENSIIKDIVRRLQDTDFQMTESARFQIQIAQESGMLYEDIIKKVAEYSQNSEKVIKKTFENSAIEALKFDDMIYIAQGLSPIPIKQSEVMLNLLKTTLNKTNGSLYNLTLTTANTTQSKFIEVCNDTYMKVSSGAFDYNTAIRQAVKQFADGVQVQYDSGYKLNVKNAVRRAVMTGVNQTCLKMQEERANEMECDLVEVTAHAGARPEHAEWQGKIYSRSGKSKKYPPLVESTGYGTGPGLGGWNCRHNMFPYFEGTARAYTDEELEELKNKNEENLQNSNENGIIQKETDVNNLFDKVKIDLSKYNANEPNDIQEQVAKLLKMDGLPKVVNSQEYEKTEGIEIIRYIHNSKEMTLNEVYKNTLYGKVKYSDKKNSQYGRGIYFGEKGIEEQLVYTYGNGNGKAINAKILNNAKILEFDSMISYIKETSAKTQNLPKELRKIYENERSLLYMIEGYDGIKINGKNYYCIFNRKVLIVKDE